MNEQLGFIGLGRMGSRMIRRLLDRGHAVVAYDADPAAMEAAASVGARGVGSLQDMTDQLQPPRVLWLMVPHTAVEGILQELLTCDVGRGDVVIDGGNSHFRDTISRSIMLEQRGIGYVDVGTSGGIRGAESGLSLTAGGAPDAYRLIEPVLKALAAPRGYAHVGPIGAGHFTKLVHNAIEYGMLESLAEGFELLNHGPFEELDLAQVADVWSHGGVLRSYLLEVAGQALKPEPTLSDIASYVEDTGLARWAVQEAVKNDVPFQAISDALYARMRSRQSASFAAKLIAAMRQQFGGHSVGAGT